MEGALNFNDCVSYCATSILKFGSIDDMIPQSNRSNHLLYINGDKSQIENLMSERNSTAEFGVAIFMNAPFPYSVKVRHEIYQIHSFLQE